MYEIPELLLHSIQLESKEQIEVEIHLRPLG